jgi:hypothetical protein
VEDLIPIVLFLVIGIVLCIAFYLRYRARQDIQRTLRLALESGRELTPEFLAAVGAEPPGGNRDLRRGLIAFALAAALALCAWPLDAVELLGFAAFPLMLGIAYLVLWRLESNRSA